MPHYLIHNQQDLGRLLREGGTDRPRLRLIMLAAARADDSWAKSLVRAMQERYRNFDEAMIMSDAQRAALLAIATGRHVRRIPNRNSRSARAAISATQRRNIPDPIKGNP